MPDNIPQPIIDKREIVDPNHPLNRPIVHVPHPPPPLMNDSRNHRWIVYDLATHAVDCLMIRGFQDQDPIQKPFYNPTTQGFIALSGNGEGDDPTNDEIKEYIWGWHVDETTKKLRRGTDAENEAEARRYFQRLIDNPTKKRMIGRDRTGIDPISRHPHLFDAAQVAEINIRHEKPEAKIAALEARIAAIERGRPDGT